MRPFYKAPRLYLDAPFKEGVELALTKPQAHHLLHVLRLRDGAQILLFNGQDGEWLARLVGTDKKHVQLKLERKTRPQRPPSDLIYCFAPLKSVRLDYMVQKATEMGAGFLQPVITQFTQHTQLSLAKMHANSVEAAQQCGLLCLPVILPALKLAELLEGWPRQRTLIFCDEELAENSDNGTDAIATLTKLSPAPQGLLIGPEGGFSDDEREILRGYPFVTSLCLGSRILRADTAAVAALTLINTICER